MPNSFIPRSMVNSLRRGKGLGEPEFNALFQILPDPALLLDNTTEQIIQANSPFLQITAYAINDIIKHPLREFIKGMPDHPLTGEDILSASLMRRFRSPLEVNIQVCVLDAEGRWLVLVIEPVEESRKSWLLRMEQVVQTLVELGDHPSDEPVGRSLERSLSIISGLLNNTAAAVYRLNEEGNRVYRAAVFGEGDFFPETFDADDLLRLSKTMIWVPGRRMQGELHRIARVENLSYMATTPISHNGVLVIAERKQEPLEYLPMLLEAAGKQISHCLAHSDQIRGLQRLVEENRREHGIWRSAGENSQEGILLLTPDLKVNEMNPAAEWMLEYADEEVKGQPVENILIGTDRLSPALESACQGIPTHNLGNVSLYRRYGQSFPAHIQVVPVEQQGEIIAIIVFFRDVSEHIEFRNRTQQLEQRAILGEVTAVFAHEVRNPINNISTGLQLLSVKLPENDPNQENIARLLNDCNRLNHLMESVLNFSRHSEYKFEEIDPAVFLKRLLDRWRPRMKKVNVESQLIIEPDAPKILGDPRSLEQVFTNLISNAVESMSSSNGGTLGIRVSPYNQLPGRKQVEISVSDDGPGIADEIRDRIFEPFLTTKPQGTGLGLAITKRIITAHRGSISLNTFPGGTVFQVILSAYEGEGE